MNNNFLIIAALMTVITSPLAFADQVINDDLIVTTPLIPVAGNTGKMCAGTDCVDNQVFGGATLLHRENNTRFRFLDNTAGDVLGQSWMMLANGSNNGGNAYFQFQARSLNEDNILLSDGSYPLLDCSASVIIGDCVTLGLTPVGDPVLIQDTSNLTSTITSPWFTVNPVLYFGANSDNTIAIGGDSEATSDVVSVGKAGLERKLVHVAEAIAATDVATLADFVALSDKLDFIDAQLNDIEQAITVIENPPVIGSGGSSGLLLSPYTLLTIFGIIFLRLIKR
ncbi:MAG: hypothetical protein COA54_15180 [Thiotrichaceae bacterium]|nr:MAG: hypothetical protein COA54_15180 [Thiotrichaceae bacterium]